MGLCAVVALYCPNELPWTEVALGEPPSMADSLYNIQVQCGPDIQGRVRSETTVLEVSLDQTGNPYT